MTISSARLGNAVSRTTLWLAVAVVALIPLAGLPREDQRATLPVELSYLYVADVAIIALALLSFPSLAASIRRTRSIEGALWTLLFALLFIAFAFNPSRSGTDLLIRLVAGVALYRAIADAEPPWRRAVAVALGVTAAVQAAVGLLQVVTGAPLGLVPLGEMTEPLRSAYGGQTMARGTLGHEYILAALAILSAIVLAGEALRSRRPETWLVPAAIAISTAGLIYGRAVGLSFALAWASLLPAALRDPRYRQVLVALLVGFGITAAIFSAGWVGSFSRGLASPRTAQVGQAAAIVEERPLFGVGPGNYLEELRSRPELHTTQQLGNVHSVPALVAAEAGIPAGIVSAALIGLVGLRALRSLRDRPLVTALYAGFFLFAVLDVLPYITPQGILLSAVWLGFIQQAERWPP